MWCFFFVHFDVHITFYFYLEASHVYGWELHGLGFCGTNIITCLIHMSLGGFSGLWLVAVDVFDCEEGPFNVVARAYGLHPHVFDSVHIDGVHEVCARGCPRLSV